MPSELGEIILKRTFDALDKNGNQRQIKLLVGKPQFELGDYGIARIRLSAPATRKFMWPMVKTRLKR